MPTFRQAVWAEFKNQRVVFYSGISIAVLAYAFFHLGPWRNPDLDFDLFHLVGSLVCLAFASCAGSLVFGRHKNESRISIFKFMLKLVVGALSATISGMSVVIALALSVRMDSPNSILDSLYPDFGYLPHFVTYVSGPFLVYACSVLFSLLFSRRWLSVLIGFAIGTVILFSIASFWVRLDFNMWMAKKPVNSTILLSGVLLLFLSWSFSSRLKAFRSSARFILGISVTLVAALSASTLMFSMRPSAAALHMGGPSLSPMGTEIVSDAYAEDTYRQIWTISTETGKGNRMIKKHAYDPVISPDGCWFAFFSQKGIFGLRSFYVDLRVAAIDGMQERVLLPKFARWISDEFSIGVVGKTFSPDSKYIALLCWTAIYVVDLEGKIKCQAAIPSGSDKALLGWHPNRLEVLLADRNRKCIEAFNIANSQFKPIYQADKDPKRLARIHSGAGIRYVGFGNELVDVDKGKAQPFPEDIGKESLDISIDQTTLIYSISSEEFKPEASSAYVHRFDIKTGRDELFAEFRGVIDRLVISPGGNRIAFEHRTEFKQLQTVVIKGNSLVRKFEGWALMGWRDSDRVVLADNNLFPKRMALGNIATGQVRQFYP